MTITAQQYAGLASDSYDESRPPGIRAPGKGERITVEGVIFEVREQYDNPRTGYQGTIYQRTDTGEIVVAHRGTEFDREAKQDGLIADGGMVLNRTNSQVPEAIALTQRAIARAKEMASDTGHTPEVSVTGHSLGGTLAQITAAKLNLRGEAFNPYGAASLNHGVKEGGHRFLNHVMAGDTVSAASPHHGQVRMYATAGEVAAVTAAGYGRLNPMPDNALLAAGLAMGAAGSHNMDNFLSVDSKKRPDVSVLDDPASQKLAERYSGTFGDYRRDVRGLRSGVSLGGDVLQYLSGSGQSVDPSAASDPHSLPEYDLRRPDHAKHGQYTALRGRIEAAYVQAGIVRSDAQLDQATAATAVDMQKYGLARADKVFLLRDTNGAISPDSGLAVQQGQYPLMLRSMTPGDALQQQPEQSFQQLQQATMQQTFEQEQQRQMSARQQQGPVLA